MVSVLNTAAHSDAAALRRFRWSDFWAVYTLTRHAFGRDAFGMDLLAWRALTSGGGFWVMQHAGEVVAYCLTRSLWWRSRGEVVAVAVRAAARGKGHGRRLMEETIAFMRTKRMRDLTLEVAVTNAPAQMLYRSLGFVLHEHLTNYYGTGRHGWRMRLDLEPQ